MFPLNQFQKTLLITFENKTYKKSPIVIVFMYGMVFLKLYLRKFFKSSLTYAERSWREKNEQTDQRDRGHWTEVC